ncbi:MAG TPA: hypothetical protein PLL10_04090, partial [Elusimicrobiales bacterium]|nr:hypothetical protein [Elusimicrobiales bacterium]
MMDAAWEFAELETVYAHYKPLSPFGRESRERREIFSRAERIAFEHDCIELALAFLKKSPDTAAKAEFHLKNIPLLDVSRPVLADLSEIFLYKKLLYHVRGLDKVLPPSFKKKTGFKWASSALLQRLQLGGGGETFYLADNYSEKLKRARAAVLGLGRELERERRTGYALLKQRFGIDFSARQFVLIEDTKAAALKHGGLLYLERYDADKMLVKPVQTQRMIALSSEYEKLVKAEKVAERDVLSELAVRLGKEQVLLAGYVAALEKLDTALAKARLALEFGLTRPRFRMEG